MELVAFLVEIFPTVGFPVICCGALGWFIYKIYQNMERDKDELAQQNAENMKQVQARCQEREDKLYNFMLSQQSINDGFRQIIEKYQVKIDSISSDVAIIKTDVEILKNK